MLTWDDRLRARMRRATSDDSGFTLIEMVISLLIFALAAQALAGVLISGATAEAFARNTTVAKGLTQQRIDAMRSLPFHVDRQNGPFVDVLDLYFPNASSSTYYVPLPDLLPGDKAPGSYVATAAGTSPATAPYYEITIPGNYLGSKYARYTQTVYTQFLYSNSPAAKPLPASAIPSGYDNGVIGADEPISPLIGVTVVTSWSSAGKTHSSTTFTEIASEGTDTNLVVAQAKAGGVLVQTQDHALNTITVTLGGVTVNGSLSNGSQSGGTAVGASIVDTDPTLISPSITGAQAAAAAPANPGPFSQSAAGTSIGSGGPCGGWGEFGPTRVSDVSASVASGLPSSPDASLGGAVTATLNAANSGGSCAGMWFSNQVDSAALTNADLGFSSSEPMVRVADTPGNDATVTGAGAVSTGAATGAGGAVTATASSSMATWLKVFPGLPFVTGTPSLPAGFPSLTGTPGLVNVYLTSAQLACVSADALGDTSATLSYSGYVVWYTYDTSIASGVWNTKAFSWPSASPGTDPLAVVDVTKPVKENADGTTTPLSAYITSVTGATAITGGSGGLKSINAAVSVGTVPTLVDSSDVAIPGTTIGVELGQLSCVAQDNRS